MTQLPETTSGKVTKLNRVERNAWTLAHERYNADWGY